MQVMIFGMVIIFYTAPIYCNIIWPAVFVSNIILGDLLYIIVASSIAIEAILYYRFLKNITYTRALLISCIGNAASVFLGTFVMTLAMMLWHLPADMIFGGTFAFPNIVVTYVLMYLGSAFIELLAIKIIFRYSFEDLWIPVFIGNIVTYILTLIFALKKHGFPIS